MDNIFSQLRLLHRLGEHPIIEQIDTILEDEGQTILYMVHLSGANSVDNTVFSCQDLAANLDECEFPGVALGCVAEVYLRKKIQDSWIAWNAVEERLGVDLEPLREPSGNLDAVKDAVATVIERVQARNKPRQDPTFA